MARTLSGGQLRRLDLALALIGDPELIFLDEPTTGFDPAARRAAWDTIRSLKDLGKTVLLTTHYLDEAQALADRVAIIKDGHIIVEGAPGSLGQHAGTAPYRIAYRNGAGSMFEKQTDDPTTLLHELTGAALARGERLEDLTVTRPTLEDVYLELTAGEDDSAVGPTGSDGPDGSDRSDGSDRCRRVRRRAPAARPQPRARTGDPGMTEVVTLAWRQYRLERRLFWRNPSAAFFNFLLPLLFLAFFGAILHGNQKELNVIVPGIAGMSVMSTTFTALAFNMTFLREQGVLKRIHGTPMPGSSYLLGIAGNAVTNTARADHDHHRRGQAVLRHRLAEGLGRARRICRCRRRLLCVARRRVLARDPQL